MYVNCPEPYIASMAGSRYEYLRCNPCIHQLVRQDVFRWAELQVVTIRYFRRKASLALRKDVLEKLGDVLYDRIEQFVRITYWQLEDSLE